MLLTTMALARATPTIWDAVYNVIEAHDGTTLAGVAHGVGGLERATRARYRGETEWLRYWWTFRLYQ